MSKTKEICVPSLGCDYTRINSVDDVSDRKRSTEQICRPARRIGQMLALQQVDGVDGALNTLFKGQYDETFGNIDPATDIHTDPHLLSDRIMREAYSRTMTESN
ncbi:MAG: hypothetical protein IKU96_00410 [Alistipes sp.]|nr:hypothetical protein [Alistipes sp.]